MLRKSRKGKEDNDILKIFNLENTFQEKDGSFSAKLNKYMSEDSYNELIVVNDKYKDLKTENIQNRITEKSKTIRLKEESHDKLSELHKILTESGLKIPITVLADFLILKALHQIKE